MLDLLGLIGRVLCMLGAPHDDLGAVLARSLFDNIWSCLARYQAFTMIKIRLREELALQVASLGPLWLPNQLNTRILFFRLRLRRGPVQLCV